MLVDSLCRHRRREQAMRWRKLSAGCQALLVVAHLRKGETCSKLACGFRIGTSTLYRYVREAIGLLATTAPTLDQSIAVAAGTPDRPSESPARDRARDVAERHAAKHGELPTVSALMTLAEVSRGTAGDALKSLRNRPTALHLVNPDQNTRTQR